MAKAPNQKPSRPKKAKAYSSDIVMVRMLCGMLLIGLGIALFMALILGTSGDIFKAIRDVSYGLCGVLAVILPVFPVWGGILLMISTQRAAKVRPFLLALLLWFLLVSAMELLTMTGSRTQSYSLPDYFASVSPYSLSFGDYLIRAWSWSLSKHAGGGAAGMLLAWPLWQAVGSTFGGILCIAGAIASLCFLLRLDVRAMFTSFRGFLQNARSRREQRAQQKAQQLEDWNRQKEAQDRNRQQLEQTPPQVTARPEVSGQWQRPAAGIPPQAVQQSRQPSPAAASAPNPRYGFQPTEEELHAVPQPRQSAEEKEAQPKSRFAHIFNRGQNGKADQPSEAYLDKYRKPEEQSADAPSREAPSDAAEPARAAAESHPAPRQKPASESRAMPRIKPATEDQPARKSTWQKDDWEEQEQKPAPAPAERHDAAKPEKQQPKPSWEDTPPWEDAPKPVSVKPGDVRVPEVAPDTSSAWQAQLNLAMSKAGAQTYGDREEARKAERRKEQARQSAAYVYPDLDLLRLPPPRNDISPEEDQVRAAKLEETLASFKVDAAVRNITHGPAITRFELELAPGINVSSVTKLNANIAMNMEVKSVRIEAPIPGKALIGIEVPNRTVSTVTLREVLESDAMAKAKAPLVVALGKDIAGTSIVMDLARMPHLLIAGATGSGKSVCINTIINSLLYRCSPREVRLILVDPKVVELQCYNGIPHLLIPVVSDPHKAAGALAWAVSEMMDRYRKFTAKSVRAIDAYNACLKEDEEYMSHIVIIIDELADLMMTCKRDVEDHIVRLSQLARAAGIHLVVATQRPSVDVITGLIKANIPSRIAFKVTSNVDSRTILDHIGAEQLLGWGDMLFQPLGSFGPTRVQGCFLSDDEVNDITEFVRSNCPGSYDPDILEQLDRLSQTDDGAAAQPDDAEMPEGDSDKSLLEQAIEMTVRDGQISTSLLQRRLRVGYARAGRLVDEMEARGIVSQRDGAKPRTCLISPEEWERMRSSDFSES